jgi:hypothetical protein
MPVLGLIAINGTDVKNMILLTGQDVKKFKVMLKILLDVGNIVCEY